VVEVPALVDRDGAHPVAVAPLAPELLGLVQAVTQYEILTIEAARTGDRNIARRALLANPLVRQWQHVPALLGDLL
jgi:6-phospho-beta-glucosidase